MMRSALAASAGYALWTVLWLGGNAAFFGAAAEAVQEGEPITAPGTLAAVLGLSLVCSLAGGYAAAALAGSRARTAVLVLGLALLATGIAVQAGVWSLMPAWYHLAFLFLLVPVTWLGGKWGTRGAS